MAVDLVAGAGVLGDPALPDHVMARADEVLNEIETDKAGGARQ